MTPFDPLSPPASTPPEGPRRKLRRLPRAGVSIGLVAGLALSGAGIAFAASSVSSAHPSSSPTTSTTLPGHGPKLKPGAGRPGLPGGARGLGGLGGLGRGVGGLGLGQIVHGQVTIPNGSGGYKTVEVQVGKVKSVNPSSITVASADGYTHTYTVVSSTIVDAQAGGIASVAGGDQVRVVAQTTSGKDTVTNVQDTTKLGQSRTGFGLGPLKRVAQPTEPPDSGQAPGQVSD